jgi:hypothetical protein
MVNLLQQLTDGLDSANLDSSLGSEIAAFASVAELAVKLKDNPAGVTDFVGALAGLAAPAIGGGADIQTGLDQARASIPTVTGTAVPDALGDLGRFGTLIQDELVPILSRSVALAQAIEGLATAQFTCPTTDPDSNPASPTATTPPPPTGAARAAVVEERATEISARIDQLPSPLTPDNLIAFLTGLMNGTSRAEFFPIAIPIFDDLIVPVQTLARWSAASPADVGAELAETLGLLRDRFQSAAEGIIDTRATTALALQAPLRVGALQTFVIDYLAAATAMADALDAADPTEAVVQAALLDAAITEFGITSTAQAADFTTPALAAASLLSQTAIPIHDQLLHLASTLESFDASMIIGTFDTAGPADTEASQALKDLLSPLVDFAEDIGEKLDLAVIEGGVATVAISAQDIADQISGALTTVAQETRATFSEVETAVGALSLDDLALDVRQGITDVSDTLQRNLRNAFEPLRQALSTAITAISDALDSLDPAAVTVALDQAIGEITGILQDPAIVAAAQKVREGLDQAAQAAGNLSFAPVTDEVINLIGQMEAGLRAISSTDLNDALIAMLNTALSVLPSDLRPVTQPLIENLGVMIEQGPVEILESIAEVPEQVVAKIRSFDPAALVTAQLGAPFDQAAAAVDQVQPSQLIGEMNTVLQAEKTRLKQTAAPSHALAPVAAAFDGLIAEFDKLSPAALLAPIEAAVEQAVEDVIATAPVDEVLREIGAVFDTISAALNTVTSVHDAMSKTAASLANLQEPDGAIDAWRDAVLDKIDAVPNSDDLDTLLTQLAAAIDSAQNTPLLARFDATLEALVTDLDTLDARTGLNRITELHQRLSPLINGLPIGADRTVLQDVVAQFDPLDPAHTGGLRAAGVLREGIADGRDMLNTLSTDYADQLYGPDGVLTALKNSASDASFLRAEVEVEIEKALLPLRFIMSQLGGAAVPVAAVADSFADLNTRLTASLGDILTGPASLQTISDTLQQVVDSVRGIDLAFLRISITEVFSAVRAQIDAVNPATLLVTLDREFGEMIDALDLSLILPEPEIADLDQAVSDVADKIRGLDPASLIGDGLVAAYEADVLPLVEALDITPVLNALIKALRGLEAQLEVEMGRINTAYTALLAARPSGSTVNNNSSASIG